MNRLFTVRVIVQAHMLFMNLHSLLRMKKEFPEIYERLFDEAGTKLQNALLIKLKST